MLIFFYYKWWCSTKQIEVSGASYDFSVVCLEFGDNNSKLLCTKAMEYCVHTKIEKDLLWQCHRTKPQLVKGQG